MAIGKTPKIRNQQDLDEVLGEISRLQYEQAREEATAGRKIAEIKTATQARQVVQVGATTMPIADRIKCLSEAALAWCDANLPAQLPDGQKSLQLPHGKVGFRRKPASVEIDGSDKEALDRIHAKTPFRQLVDRVLQTLLGIFPLSSFVRVKYELDRVSIKKAWETSPEADRATMDELGIRVSEGSETVFIEPAAYEVTAPAA